MSAKAAERKGAARPVSARRRMKWLVAGGIALAVAIAALLPAWLARRERAQVREILPDAAAAIAAGPAVVVERLADADRQARDGHHALQAAGALAQLYDANWRPIEAAQLYRGLRRLQPGEPRWSYALALLDGAGGALDDARHGYEQTLALAPQFLPAALKLADVCLKLGDREAARRVLADSLQRDPANPFVSLALARIEAADPAAARRLLESATAAHPRFAPAWTQLALLHDAAGRTAEATLARERAAAGARTSEPEDLWADEILEVCYRTDRLRIEASAAATAGRVERARRWIERAATLEPNDAAVQRERGRLCRLAGDWSQARASFEQAVRIEPAFADNWANLQEACLKLGDTAAASRALDEGLRLSPDSPGLRLASARRYAATGRPDDAIREFRVSIRLRPQEAIARIDLSAVLFQRERVEEGIAELEAALAAEPDHPLALSTLTFVHIGLGNETAARSWLERVRRQPRVPRDDLAALERRFREQYGRAP